MRLSDANIILRNGIILQYFRPELKKIDYKDSDVKHPNLQEVGLTKNSAIHIFFDIYTGSDYPDGDEWFMVDYLVPYNIDMPDTLKSPDYFSSVSSEGKRFWRHRELIRYKYGKIKRMEEALNFIDKRASDLYKALEEASVIKKISQLDEGQGKSQPQ